MVLIAGVNGTILADAGASALLGGAVRMNGGGRRFFAPQDWSRRTLLNGSGLAALAVAPGGALAKTAATRGPLHSLDGGRLFHIEQTRINPDGAARPKRGPRAQPLRS